MKKTLAILLCAAALITTGCVSSSSKQKLSDDESMIVMRAGTYRDNPGAKSGRNYYLHVSDIDEMCSIPGTEDKYIFFKIYNDQAKFDKLMSRMKSGWSGSPYTNDLDIELPYSPGKLIVLDLRIALELEKVGSSSYQSNVEFYQMNEEEINELMAEIKTDPEFESWF